MGLSVEQTDTLQVINFIPLPIKLKQMHTCFVILGEVLRVISLEGLFGGSSPGHTEESAHLIRQVWRHRNCIKKVEDI